MALLQVLGLRIPKRGLPPVAAPARPGAVAAEGDAQTGTPAGIEARGDGDGTATVQLPPQSPALAPVQTGAGAGTVDAGDKDKGPPVAAADKNANAYAIARTTVKKLVDAVKAHPQKDKIPDAIKDIDDKLVAADNFASAKDWTNASKALGELKTLCTAAKKLEEDWAAWLRDRAEAEALGYAFGSGDFDAKAYLKPKLDAADLPTKNTPPDFATARNLLKAIPDELRPIMVDTIATVKKKIAAVEATGKATREFAKKPIDEGKGHLAAAEKHLAAKQWSQCWQRTNAALRLLGPAARTCERRDKYEVQRTATQAELAKMRALPVLKGRVEVLDKEVLRADALAAIDSLKIEAGIDLLKTVAGKAAMWTALGPTLAEHTKERAGADLELAALDKHAAAAKVDKQREAARLLLAGAKNVAVVADGLADPTAAWAAILADVKRARADVAAAKALADSLGAVAGAEAAAAKPGNKMALKAALEKLQADGAAAANAPHADAAKDEFKRFTEQAKAAADALAKNDGDAAAKAMGAAATALAAAKAIQSGHVQFVAALPDLEARLKLLQDSPRAPKIQPKIQPVADALADAKTKDRAHDAIGAMAAVRKGIDAVADAKAADAAREAYDKRSTDLAALIGAVADPAEKGALDTMAVNAAKHADALKFDDASKEQDKIEVRLDKGKLDGLMKAAAPDQAKITELAKKMVGKGGAADIDKLIHDIPDGGDMKLMNALAEGRYGVKFSSAAPLAGGDPVKSMRQVCDMFAKIPQDIVGNPSVTGVEWEDAIGSAGGSHSYDDAKVRMSGRPVIKQKFGANQENKDPKTGAMVKQLPPDIEDKCKPKDTAEVDYLAFAAAHEVAHGIDDARGFMARRGHEPAMGGWTTFGASVQPIVDALAGDARFAAFCKTKEQKQYVLDRLLNKPATPPAAKPGPEADALKEFDDWLVLATAKNVYRRQGDCETIKIGDYVYHEAYARVWVRYLAAARKQALTGYQFRAPGEWFAELYAGWRSDKLKDDHPAVKGFLTSL